MVTQAELQQALQRFSSELTAGVVDATEPLRNSQNAEVREAATRQLLVYASSALEIATEPLPEVALLDMLVFVTLSHGTVDNYWVPKLYGAQGRQLAETLARSETLIWDLAEGIMSQSERAALKQLIDAWRAENPGQVAVEGVRFHEFSSAAGEISQEQAKKTKGLLSSVKSATQSADQAVLLGERAVYLAHRMPFLLRLQATVGAHDVLADATVQMEAAQGLVGQTAELRPLVHEVAGLVASSTTAVRETRMLVDAVRPILPERLPEGLAIEHLRQLDRITDKVVRVVDDLRTMAPGGENDVAGRLDGLVRRWMLYALGVGAVLIALFWVGYYVARPAAMRRALPPTAAATALDERPPRHPGDDGRPRPN